jgi:predicted metal-dependent HD superfamily phosphohydrolase
MSVTLLQETEDYIEDFYKKDMPVRYVFHDLEHVVQTVAAARMLGEGFSLAENDMLLLTLAAWFHDTGYTDGPEGHEERSCSNAIDFLKNKLPQDDLDVIAGLIRATKVPQQPQTQLQQIICDADLSHLGMDTYWDRNSKFRQELILARQIIMSDQDWVDFELNFMLGHNYHTTVANEMFNKKKAKHIQQLVKQKKRLNPNKPLAEEEIALMDEKDRSTDLAKLLKETEGDIKLARMGRGVETMYRTTYRTHTTLSSLADSKANLMLSISALVISIMATNLPKLFENNKLDLRFLVPSIMLMGTCLLAMIYATLSTRPKVTEGKVTIEAIKQRKANLLFFGNFHNMSLDEFQWGVTEMLKDPDFLYSSMSRDLYFLGIVLAKKYRYLSYCYNIFMYGLILSVFAFIIAFAI